MFPGVSLDMLGFIDEDESRKGRKIWTRSEVTFGDENDKEATCLGTCNLLTYLLLLSIHHVMGCHVDTAHAILP